MENIVKNVGEKGGTLTVRFIPVDDVISIPTAINKSISDPIVLLEGKAFFQMQHKFESVTYDEKPIYGKDGEEYTVKLSGFVPGDTPQLKALFERMLHKRYIMLTTDAEKNIRLLGSIENGLRFSYDFGINPKISGSKGYNLTFSHKTTETPPFYLSNFVEADAPDVLFQPHVNLFDERFTIKDLTDPTKALEFVVDAVPTGTTKKIYMADDDVYLQDLLDLRDNNLIAVTPTQLQTHITNSTLKPGRFYKVSIYNAIVQAIAINVLSPLGVRDRRLPKYANHNIWYYLGDYYVGNTVIYNDIVYLCIQNHNAYDYTIGEPGYWEAQPTSDLTYYSITYTKIVFSFASNVLTVHTEEFTDGNYQNLLKDWATAKVFLKDSYRIYNGKLVRALVSHYTTAYATDKTLGFVEEVVSTNNLSDLSDVAAARVNLEIDKQNTFGNANYTQLATDKVIATSVAFTAPRTVTLINGLAAGKEILIIDQLQTVTSANTLTIAVQTGKSLNGVVNGTTVIQSAGGWRRLVTDGSGNWNFDAGIVRQSQTQTISNKTLDNTNVINASANRKPQGYENTDSTVTGSTNQTVLANIPIPASSIGANGKSTFIAQLEKSGVAGGFTVRAYLSTVGTNTVGTTGTPASSTLIGTRNITSTILSGGIFTRQLQNKNSESLNKVFPTAVDSANDVSTSTSAMTTTNINTAVNLWLVITGQLGSLADTGILSNVQNFIDRP